MRILFQVCLGIAVLICTGLALELYSQRERPEKLTADDLAEVMGVHWWTVKVPTDLGPKDMITTELISSDGKVVATGGGFSGERLGNYLRVYCWEDEARQSMAVRMTTKGGAGTAYMTDCFKDAATSGVSNVAALNVGDILFKFDPTAHPSFTGGNFLQPGQFGLRVAIKRP